MTQLRKRDFFLLYFQSRLNWDSWTKTRTNSCFPQNVHLSLPRPRPHGTRQSKGTIILPSWKWIFISYFATMFLENCRWIYYAICVHTGAVTIIMPKSHRNKIFKMLRSYSKHAVNTSPKWITVLYHFKGKGKIPNGINSPYGLMTRKLSFESKAQEKALTRTTFHHKNKPLSNNLYMLFPSQIAKFQTKIKTTIQLPPLKYGLSNRNGKTILAKEMLLGTDSKGESTVNISQAGPRALVDRRCLDSILNHIPVCNDCNFSQDFSC